MATAININKRSLNMTKIEGIVVRGDMTLSGKARKVYLSNNPLCKHCMDKGRLTPATVVDHIVPHKGDYTLFWDEGNWQPLCKRHHDIKTATEDGGFGRDSNKK